MDMNHQKKKQKKGRTTESSSSSLPLDVISKILSKLPSKSLARSRCVSKLWSSVTINPYFINSFKGWPKLLLCFKDGDKMFVFSIPQHNQIRYDQSYTFSSSQLMDCYHVTYPQNCSITIKNESVNGLICFKQSTNPVVWNPSMRSFVTLSKPEKMWNAITVFLGYDPTEGKHKVLCMPFSQDCNECRVLTLGSAQESWRVVKTNHMHHPRAGFHGRCINGVLYYQADINSRFIIMRFDVRSEKLDMIEMPLWGNNNVWRMEMMAYEGRLALVGSTKHGIKMCVLKDADKGVWLNSNYLPLSHYGHCLKSFKLVGITIEGELVYVPKTFLKCFHILYVDPKRNTHRRVEYGGIVDEDFRRQNGFGDKRLAGLQFFPNHIETHMSL